VLRVAAPERVKRTEMLTGSADEVAGKIVERLLKQGIGSRE